MSYYNADGYIDMRKIRALGLPWCFLVGGRGTGKTFGALEMAAGDGIPFLFMRRTQAQTDLINKPEFSPFKAVNRAHGWEITCKPVSKYNGAFYRAADDVQPIGYTAALSTISNIRGFDASDVELLIYDEFIPEQHERPIKHEAAALLNAYETVNRNRELQGRQPLQVFCLANANDPGNAIFAELGLVSRAVKMMQKGQTVFIDQKRGIGLFIFQNSPISEKKKDTALYRLVNGGEFADMAINNRFSGTDTGHIRPRPLGEYRAVVCYGELCIYEHKSRPEYYATLHKSGSPEHFTTSDSDTAAFLHSYAWIWSQYLDGHVFFENYLCERILTNVFR